MSEYQDALFSVPKEMIPEGMEEYFLSEGRVEELSDYLGHMATNITILRKEKSCDSQMQTTIF